MIRRIEEIIENVEKYITDPEQLDLIRKAYVYAAKNHAGQLRKSGEPYLIHPIEVAMILADMQMDAATVATGLLHDTVEDTLVTLEDIESGFGKDIANMVDGVTKLSQIKFHSDEHKQAENFRKMLVAMAKDIRVIIVKLADRLHNMRTLQFHKPEKQERIARETMEIYAPIASRLGIYWMKSAFEDLAFQYIKPKEFKDLQEHVNRMFAERETIIKDITAQLTQMLQDEGIDGTISGRPKHLWSIYHKMQLHDIPLENIYDLLAFRIIVNTVGDCYHVLGAVHRIWHPIPGRIKDYIAVPKPNGYSSLHTTLMGPSGERFEVQIRTKEMHEIAEKGVAAHWKYKAQGDVPGQKAADQFTWLRHLLEWRSVEDPHEFMDAVKWDLFADEVFVFTPKGDVFSLRRGSTPVDFAFSIHTDLGFHCSGAKINGKIVPLRYELCNGDVIEILTNPNQTPSKDWLVFVKTAKAKAKIRSYIKAAERSRSLQLGREILEKEIKKHGGSLAKMLKDGQIATAAKDEHFQTVDELFISVGYGKTTAQKVLSHLFSEEELEKPEEPESILSKFVKKATRHSSSGVKVQGIDDMLVRFGKCCNPLPGDNIVGFVTRGRGITIHTATCQKILDIDPARRVEVNWDAAEKVTRPVTLRVKTGDNTGLLAKISQTFTNHGVNISSANCKVTANNYAINTFEISIRDSDQLRSVVMDVEQIKGVISVERI